MAEELGIQTQIKRLIGVYSDPTRDPRQHVVSVVYELEPLSDKFKAGDDAAAFEIVTTQALSKLEDQAFDHTQVISEAIRKIKSEK